MLWEGEGVVTVGFDAKVLSSDYGSMRVKLSPTANMDCAATLAAYFIIEALYIFSQQFMFYRLIKYVQELKLLDLFYIRLNKM